MKSSKITLCLISLATFAFVSVSCGGDDIENNGVSENRTSTEIRPGVSNATDFVETKAGNAPELTKVYGSEEDGFVIEEYVSDIAVGMPGTKGTIVTTDNIPTLTNYGSFHVNAYRNFYEAELSETGDKDNTDNDDDVYDNGTKSTATKAVRDFSMTSNYSGGSWQWSGTTPHWRNKSVYSIWSMAPANSGILSPATIKVKGSAVPVPEPDWTALSSVADINKEGKTPEEIEAAEAARQEEIQSHFRSLEFDYSLPAYAPATAPDTASTSIYKDLLFAYNEEFREFEEENGKLKIDAQGHNIIKDGRPGTFPVNFYHALAAVKFEIVTDFDGDGSQDTKNGKPDFHGADIHSITLCYTDSSNRISATTGLATSGHCKVTGTSTASGKGEGSRTVNFEWPADSLGGRKPMHFVFNDGYTSSTKVSGGYASTGDGVLFMIPQTASNLKVIVEFSKYGGSDYYTRVYNTGIDVDWKAGKYYTYRLKIGEFHVPGELLELSSRIIAMSGLKNSGASTSSGKIAFTSDVRCKGTLAVGFLLADYASNVGAGGSGSQNIYLMASKNGVDTYKDKTGAQIQSGLADKTITPTKWTDINFKYVESTLVDIAELKPDQMASAVDAIDYTRVYGFGLAPDETEEYYSLYDAFGQTDPTIGKPANDNTAYAEGYSGNGPYYFAFRFAENEDDNPSNDTNTFNIIFKSAAGSNNCGFSTYVLGMMVLEVKEDKNIPTDFSGFDWTTI